MIAGEAGVRLFAMGGVILFDGGWRFGVSGKDFPANELRENLRKPFGSSPPSERNPTISLRADSALPDGGFSIDVRKSGVKIRGGGEKGLLNGVYGFLEALGFRWAVPGTRGEVVPRSWNSQRGDRERQPLMRQSSSSRTTRVSANTMKVLSSSSVSGRTTACSWSGWGGTTLRQ